MSDLFTKAIDTITADDVAALLEHGPAEGPTVEYKAALSEAEEDPDPWLAGMARIGGRARDRIVKEVVAFANAGGGTLVLGVAETEGDPPRPGAIRPLPRCAALANHLTDVLKSAIDPALPLIHIHSVPIDGHDGVVVIRVPTSRRAPHRCANSRHAYKRFHHQSTPIDMREIHELVLHTRSGLDRLEERLAERRRRFEEEWGEALPHSDQHAWACAITVAPVQPLNLARFGDVVPLGPALREFGATLVAGERVLAARMRSHVLLGKRRPMVRGVRLVSSDNPWVRAELHQDGLVDLWIRADARENPHNRQNSLILGPAFILTLLLNALIAAHDLRLRTAQPECELAVSLLFYVPLRSRTLPLLMGSWENAGFGAYESWVAVERPPELPRYSIAAIGEAQALLREIHRDLMDASGQPYSWNLQLDTADVEAITRMVSSS